MRKPLLVLLVSVLLALASCKAAPQRPADVLERPSIPVKEQDEKALAEYKAILESTAELRREQAVPVLAEGYARVIDQYPASFLAEESHYRLMLMNLQDFFPPREEEAEKVYREYFSRYKNPRIGMTMNGDLARYYYKNQRWEKLAKFTLPFMKEYVKSGKYGDTVFIFFYTEAKFFMKDYDEARKGYLIIKENFKGKSNARIAEERLEFIKSLKVDEKAR